MTISVWVPIGILISTYLSGDTQRTQFREMHKKSDHVHFIFLLGNQYLHGLPIFINSIFYPNYLLLVKYIPELFANYYT